MDIIKLSGIVEAIEGEGKLPSPSHNNLARLVAMFCKELIEGLFPPPAIAESSTETIGIQSQTITVEVLKKTPRKKRKESK